MLMDRKKIRRLEKWGAIILALVFALGTVFLGVGSKTGNILSGCSKNTSGSIDSSSSFEDRENYYKAQVEDNPKDDVSMLALASLYADQSIGRYDDAVFWLNKVVELQPNNVDLRLRIAGIYLNNTQNYNEAVKVLTQTTQMAPNNAQAFLYLGVAAKDAGQNQTAIMAWNKFLELDPNNTNAAAIKEEINKLANPPASTTPQTTTVPGSPGTSIPVSPLPNP